MEGRVKLVKIIYGKRYAGHGTVDPPPDEYIGQIGTIWRPLINSEIPCYWVEFPDGERFVLAEDELEEVKE